MKHNRRSVAPLALMLLLPMLGGCGRADGSYYAEHRTFENFNLVEALSLDLSEVGPDLSEPEPGETPPAAPKYPNRPEDPEAFRMRVYGEMEIYDSVGGSKVKKTLTDGTLVDITPMKNKLWAEVYSMEGTFVGYAKDGFSHAIDPDSTVYATLPVEYGQARTNENTYVDAYSHLVDIRRYLRVYSSTSGDYKDVDLSKYDVVVSMQLSTDDTTIREPFYNRNLCMIQYDLLPKLKAAIDRFKKDGYTIIIYDAYRPTSVQQRWFDVVGVHKWVADPSRGMGGVHDRGTALDMSLLDKNGRLLEMPTPMHTFSEAASRLSTKMTDTARANMDYMLDVMVDCGFGYINSEWWHFQDTNTVYYLPTDHAIDGIPLTVAERTGT